MTNSRSIQALSNPMLHYRLDLGEPGVATPSRASQSIMRVTAHELQNIQRFKAEAAREGGIVVYHGVKLNLSYEGAYLAAIGGLSQARVVYPNGKQDVFNQAPGGSEEDPPISKEAEPLKEALETPENVTNDLLSSLATQSTITQLQVEKAQLQQKIREAQANTTSSIAGPYEPSSLTSGESGLSGKNGTSSPVQTSPRDAIREYQLQQKIWKLNQEIARLSLESNPGKGEEPPDAPSRLSSMDPSLASSLLDVLA
ncbi:MAG: hypothetical protein DRH17_03800 [Deltaproteobacteria bacterium]|nr:MAG: hypothetical protein DRH17_03800 [Deltaproteobacteria bacterium]